MNDYHVVLGGISVLLALLAYGLYIRSIVAGSTKPHPFTWFLFVVLDSTVFFAQITSGGGAGAWITGVSAALNVVVFLLAFTRGEQRITRFDWLCLGFGLAGIVLWWLTSQPLAGVVLASLADAIAKIPTIRKSLLRPEEESITIWSFDIIIFSLSIAALGIFSWTTVLFPAEVILTNSLLAGLIFVRRRQLARLVEFRLAEGEINKR